MLMLTHRILFGMLGLVILLLVLYYIRTKRLTTEFSLLWFFAGFFLLVQIIPSSLLIRVAAAIHVQPLALVCIVFFLFVSAILFYYSLLLSKLFEANKRLIQKVAILESQLDRK